MQYSGLWSECGLYGVHKYSGKHVPIHNTFGNLYICIISVNTFPLRVGYEARVNYACSFTVITPLSPQEFHKSAVYIGTHSLE